MKVYGRIYVITNTINGKVYIGATTVLLRKRWAIHVHHAKNQKKGNLLYKEMAHYGKQHFSLKVIKTCFSEDQLYNSEIFFIKEYQSTNPDIGYNNSSGGKNSSFGKRLSNETKKKISEVQRGKKRKPLSQATKNKIGNANRGRISSAATRLAMSNGNKGRKASQETRLKLSLAKKGQNAIPVLMKNLNGNILAIFPGATFAAKRLEISQSSIANNLIGLSKTAGGFIWGYLKTN